MFSEKDERYAEQLAAIQMGTNHQLNILFRIQRILMVLVIAVVICAIALCWPFLISLVTLGLGMLVFAFKFIPDIWPYLLGFFFVYSIFLMWLEQRPDRASRLKYANCKRIEENRKKRDAQMEADMAAYFKKMRTQQLRPSHDSETSI